MEKDKKMGRPPSSMTIEQASEFWDEHALIDFEGTERATVHFQLRRKRYVGIAPEIFKRLEARARRENLTVEKLLESLIAEKAR